MTCADLEILLCDYVEGSLDASGKAQVEGHLASCAACAELAGDAAAAMGLIERAAAVEPPAELMNRLLFQAPGRHSAKPGAMRWLRHRLAPVLQPRWAMGMAMTILSFSMLSGFVGINRQLRPDDLRPAKVWMALDDKAHRTWERAVKYYENLRFVYEVQSRLNEWKTQADGRVTLPADVPPGQIAPGANDTEKRTVSGSPSQAIEERQK